jgi:PhnB protein
VTKLEPYIFFEGRAEEAIEFYKQALGAKVELLIRNSDCPEPPPPDKVKPGSENKIMHAVLIIDGQRLLISDGECSGQSKIGGFSVALSNSSEADVRRYFEGLSEGGQVHLPLTQTFFSPLFGMVQDKFGVGWMVNLMPAG